VINETSIVVRADSPDITNSPFVYFTGHQNFTLTEAEVDNLRTYLLQGFAIVANSSLPGRRSRFDVAFRREMKRVMPDHELEPITKDHGLFSAFYKFERIPVGVNYWQEPIEVIAIDGRVVVIYNLNDYGDLMLARLSDDYKTIRAGWRVDIRKDAKGKEIITPLDASWEGPRVYSQWTRRRNLYAGCEDVQTVIDAFNININILAYLLTR